MFIPSKIFRFLLICSVLHIHDAAKTELELSTQLNSACTLETGMNRETCRIIIRDVKSSTIEALDPNYVPEWSECTRPGKDDTYVCIRGQWKHKTDHRKAIQRNKRGFLTDLGCFATLDYFCGGKPANKPPSITCQGTDQNVYYTSKGETTVIVSWPLPSAYDNEDGNIGTYQTQGTRSGTLHEEGMYLITYMAKDNKGATASCSFTFTVKVRRCTRSYTYILHGLVECSPSDNINIYGSICSYDCNEGYELVGSKVSECLESENWSTDKPFCKAITCGPPPKVQRGSFTCEDPNYYFYQSLCALTCDLGYETDKNDSIRCHSNRKWTVPGACNDVSPPTIDCSPDIEIYAGPQLANVIVTWNPPVSQDNSGYPVNVTSTIQSGSFFKVGTTPVIFTALDAANNIAYCTKLIHVGVKRCPEYVASNNSNVICSHGNAYGSVCTTTCQQAYELVSLKDPNQTCLEDKTWNGKKPACKPMTCASPPIISNGNFSCPDGMKYQDVCTISCDEGFTAQPPLTITCNINVEWSQTGSCLDTNAPAFPYGCPASFEVEAASLGEPTYVNYTLPKATDNSNEPVVLLGNPISGSAFKRGTNMVTVTATDRQGNSANCTFFIKVKSMSCDEPQIETSGKVLIAYSCPNQYLYGASCLLNCTDGNPIQGPSSIRCDKNSAALVQWVWPGNVKPYCNAQSCPKLSSPINGALACDVFGVGSEICYIMCNFNFTYPTSAPEQYTCSKGKWMPYSFIPGCTARRQPSEALTKPSFYYYSGDCSTNSSQIKENFLLILDDLGLSDVCGDDCTVNNVEVTCGPVPQRRKKKDTQPFLYKIEAVIALGKYKDQNNPEVTQQYYQTVVDTVNKHISNASDLGKFNIPGIGKLFSYKNGESVFTCEPGKIIVYTTMSCAGCGQGYSYNNATGVCDKCPQGTYQDQEISFRCTPCPEGTTTRENMSRSLADCQKLCLPGQYSSSGIQTCSPCPKGSYTTLYGTKQCTLCPYGMTTTSTGAKSLQDCIFSNIRFSESASYPAIQIFDDVSKKLTFMAWIYDETTIQKSFLKFSIKPPTSPSSAALVIDTVVLQIQRNTDISIRKILKWNHVALVYTSGNLTLFVNGQKIESINNVTVTKLLEKDIHFQNSSVIKSVMVSGIQMTKTAYTESQIKEFSTSCNKQVDNHVLAFKPWESLIMTNSTCNAMDLCSNEPCGQHSTCISGSEGFTCVCADPWSGEQCQNAPDFCHGNLCSNGSTCINQTENMGYRCSCQIGFTGVLCNEANKPVNGSWGNWSQWSSCSVTCGSGVKSRSRECDNPKPENGGEPCQGLKTETEVCDTGCRDCKWNEWAQWSCDVTCGSGTATRTRSVASDAVNGGLPCQGAKLNTKLCTLAGCAVDGGFGTWGEWSTCSSSCGGGVSTRQRSCDNPAPSQGGKPCDTHLATEKLSCNNHECQVCKVPELREGQKEWNCSTDSTGLMTCNVICHANLVVMPFSDYIYQCGPTSNFTWSQQTKDNPVGLTQACSDKKIPESLTPVITTTFSVDCSKKPSPGTFTISVNQQLLKQECYKSGTCAFAVDASLACEHGIIVLSVRLNYNYNNTDSTYLGGLTETEIEKQKAKLIDLQQILENIVKSNNSIFIVVTDGEKYIGIVQTVKTSVTCHDGSGYVGGFCVDCPAGTYSAKNGSCLYCDKGMYQDKPKQLSCIMCPPGTTTSGKGSYSPAHCMANPITHSDVYPFFDEVSNNNNTHIRAIDTGDEEIIITVVPAIVIPLLVMGIVITISVKFCRNTYVYILARTTLKKYKI